MEQQTVTMCGRYEVYHFNCHVIAVPNPEQAKAKMVTLPSKL